MKIVVAREFVRKGNTFFKILIISQNLNYKWYISELAIIVDLGSLEYQRHEVMTFFGVKNNSYLLRHTFSWHTEPEQSAGLKNGTGLNYTFI